MKLFLKNLSPCSCSVSPPILHIIPFYTVQLLIILIEVSKYIVNVDGFLWWDFLIWCILVIFLIEALGSHITICRGILWLHDNSLTVAQNTFSILKNWLSCRIYYLRDALFIHSLPTSSLVAIVIVIIIVVAVHSNFCFLCVITCTACITHFALSFFQAKLSSLQLELLTNC